MNPTRSISVQRYGSQTLERGRRPLRDPMTKSRKRAVVWGGGLAAVAAVILGFTTLGGARSGIDPSRLATVERGTMVRSVVATGKIEPISKVEIKSKANGIIEALSVDVGDLVASGDVLAELDKEQLAARLRE
jgi:HlyD family secretion protein